MPSRTVHVTAASRLHFGLLSLGGEQTRQYGGVGVMVQPPQVRIRIGPSNEFQVVGEYADRAIEFVTAWSEYWRRPNPPACRLVIEDIPNMHIGLGTGTQFALSLAAGLNRFFRLAELPPRELSRSVGRGTRSAVGTYGFLQGGLIYEMGKARTDELGELARRVTMPDAWRFVLVNIGAQQGIHGADEKRVFDQLRGTSKDVSKSLSELAEMELVPAALHGDFERFSRSVYQFGYRSGLSFLDAQGGPYNGPWLSEIVTLIRSFGIEGVGQSSWGPTIFAVCANQNMADQLCDQLKQNPLTGEAELIVAKPCNQGAQLGEENG